MVTWLPTSWSTGDWDPWNNKRQDSTALLHPHGCYLKAKKPIVRKYTRIKAKELYMA